MASTSRAKSCAILSPSQAEPAVIAADATRFRFSRALPVAVPRPPYRMAGNQTPSPAKKVVMSGTPSASAARRAGIAESSAQIAWITS